MSFNNGNERRKLNAKWEHLRVQYREAGMSKEAIQAMYEFDLDVLNSERAYDANTVQFVMAMMTKTQGKQLILSNMRLRSR